MGTGTQSCGGNVRGACAVFGALEAAGCGGGCQVERRKRTDPKVPTGTTESSPRFQPWVASGKRPEPQRGERKDGAGPVRSFVPDGTRFIFAPQPSDESLGYSRASLRDVESRHAKPVQRFNAGFDPSAVPSGLGCLAGCFPALKRRAVLKRSLRDKGTQRILFLALQIRTTVHSRRRFE